MDKIPPISSPASQISSFNARSALELSGSEFKTRMKGLSDEAQAEIVAREMESNFFSTMLKAMRATVPENELFGSGPGQEMFIDMLDQEYAKLSSDHWAYEFHDALVRQILNKPTVPNPDSAEETPAVAAGLKEGSDDSK